MLGTIWFERRQQRPDFMLKTVQTCTATFILLLLLGAASPPDDPGSNSSAKMSASMRDAANTIANAIAEAKPVPAKDEGCATGEKRESELCAQWQAVDAARQSARYALWSFIVGAISTGLLVWTLWETRANARRELRAYLSAKVSETQITYAQKAIRVSFSVISHNGGATPAYDVIQFGFAAVMPHAHAKSELSKPKAIEKGALGDGTVVHAGDDFPSDFNTEVAIPEALLSEIRAGALGLYVFGVCSYTDTFGYRRRTDYCHFLSGDRFTEAYDAGLQGKGEPVVVKWTLARFHNWAT